MQQLIFKLNNKFYNAEVIKTAIDEFGGFCNIRFDEDSFEIILLSKEEYSGSLEEVKNEFCNYCLGMMR